MSGDRTEVERIFSALSPEGLELAKRVLQLENEHLHIKNPSQLPDDIVRTVKGLIK